MSGSKVELRDHSQLLSQWHCFVERGFTPVEGESACCFLVLVSCFRIFSPPPGCLSFFSDHTSVGVALKSLHVSFSAPEKLILAPNLLHEQSQMLTQKNKNRRKINYFSPTFYFISLFLCYCSSESQKVKSYEVRGFDFIKMLSN